MAQNERFSGPFKFNLLPPKSDKEIEIEIERDDSVLYSMVLVFVAGLAFFLLTMANILLITPRVQEFESAVSSREAQVEQFSSIKSLHGELFIKTETLKPVLEKKIDTNEIFRVAEAITAIRSDVSVEGYGRERTGLFLFEVRSTGLLPLPDLVEGIEQIEGVSQVFFRSTRVDDDPTQFTTVIALSIDAA